ncbi:hypothetical protein CVT25_010323 [Psilocybe cyanescens]|uniref:CCHC-type domain-containing protein n=1 Tax=Psilocybe cyanescens TaxID=93625 RepID=A0A409XDL8_PSICY|nr:hypothetical protein CVT25_010323 [Psilocybe cyanescens]
MSFIDTPAASSPSTSANSRRQGKQPAVPRYAQTLSTPEVINLLANDETAQKICSQFEDPDIILAIDELAKVSRAQQQEEQEIRLARQRSHVRDTMATILLDQLQSWGFERELYDVLKEICCESPTVQKLSVFSFTSTPLQNAVPSRPLPARPPAYRRTVSPPASTPSRSPVPMSPPRQSPKTMTRQQSSSNASSTTMSHSMSTTSVTCYHCGEPGHIRPKCPQFKCIYCHRYAPGHSFRDCSYYPENNQHIDPYYRGVDNNLLDDAGIANTTGEPYRDH